jgi:MFS family permease
MNSRWVGFLPRYILRSPAWRAPRGGQKPELAVGLFSAGGTLGIAGGMVSSHLGAKHLIIGSLLLASVPLYAIFVLTPGTFVYFIAVVLAGALLNAGMPLLIVTAQDLSPSAAATASGMMMGFSAGVAGLLYVLIGRLQESLGLAPAMAVGYVSLFAGAILATVAIKPRPAHEETPVEKLSCLCSPCMEQNVAAYPQRMSSI